MLPELLSALRPSRRVSVSAALGVALVVVAVPVVTAAADPTAGEWAALRHCESSGNYRTNTGNAHYGAYQFDLTTWRSVGGHGLPSNASKGEQDARALILYRERGWQPWQCARIIGLHDDKDARSGRISDIVIPGHPSTPAPKKATKPRTSAVPAYPSSRDYTQGVTNSTVARWQKQMAKRGAPLHGTGVFGPTTTAVAKALQRQNGLGVTGELGPNTWRLAWTGKYRASSVAAPNPAAKPKPVATKPKPVVAKPKPVVAKPKPVVAPQWPGAYYSFGDSSPYLAQWQKALHHRGVKTLQGTGVFGANTLAWVKHLQTMNGLARTGLLGPNTWKLAWAGRL